jgi:acyl-CoA hydrolase
VPKSAQMAEDLISCVQSSDAVTDFFVSNGVGDCQEMVCKFLGVESAEDLKLVTAEDIHGSQFSMWARGSLTIVQQKKLHKAFS